MRSILAVLLVFLLLVGCGAYDTYSEGLEYAKAVEEDMNELVGSEPFVGFRWENGSLKDVTVAFTEIPAELSAEQIAQLAKQSIGKHFSETPGQITISFTIRAQ